MSVVQKAREHLRIVRLEMENFKRIRAISICPDGNVVEIRGENGSGKSSILDGLWAVFEGKGVIQSRPIRDGEDRGFVKVTLSNGMVGTRTFKRKPDGQSFTTDLKFESADGARFSGPQEMFNALIGELSFDPLEFARSDKKTQFDKVKALVPGVDFDKIEGLDAADRSKRTEINALAKEKRAQAGPSIPNAPTARIDEAALIDEMQRSVEHNGAIERERANRSETLRRISLMEQATANAAAEIETLRRRIEDLLTVEAVERAGIATTRAAYDALPALAEPIDATAVRAQLDAAKIANAAFDKQAQRNAMIVQAELAEMDSEDLTAAIKKREADKQAAIAKAGIPVAGVSFGDGEILLRGVPFDQGSDAEQLIASIELAAALDPTLRVMRVKEASLLDKKSMAIVHRLAGEHDFQIWTECVAHGETTGFIIEDGALRAPRLQAAE